MALLMTTLWKFLHHTAPERRPSGMWSKRRFFSFPLRGRPVDVQSSGLCSRNEGYAAAPGKVFLAQLCDGFLELPTTLV